MKCPNSACNAAIDDDSVFCDQCGTAIPKVKAEGGAAVPGGNSAGGMAATAAATMECPQCFLRVTVAPRCEKCGADLPNPVDTPAKTKTPNPDQSTLASDTGVKSAGGATSRSPEVKAATESVRVQTNTVSSGSTVVGQRRRAAPAPANSFWHCVENWRTSKGRTTRMSYWKFAPCAMLVLWTIKSWGDHRYFSEFVTQGILGPLGVVVLWMLATASIRRLHDVNQTGHRLWWFFTGFGILVVLFYVLQPGDQGANQYGPARS